jgi:hypothetical protein
MFMYIVVCTFINNSNSKSKFKHFYIFSLLEFKVCVKLKNLNIKKKFFFKYKTRFIKTYITLEYSKYIIYTAN